MEPPRCLGERHVDQIWRKRGAFRQSPPETESFFPLDSASAGRVRVLSPHQAARFKPGPYAHAPGHPCFVILSCMSPLDPAGLTPPLDHFLFSSRQPDMPAGIRKAGFHAFYQRLAACEKSSGHANVNGTLSEYKGTRPAPRISRGLAEQGELGKCRRRN